MKKYLSLKSKSMAEKVAIIVWLALCAVMLVINVRELKVHGKAYEYNIEEYSEDGNGYRSPQTVLKKGNYMIAVSYTSASPVEYKINYGKDMDNGFLQLGYEVTDYIPLVLDNDYTNIYISLYPSDGGIMELKSVTVVSDKPIVNDYYLYLALIILLLVLGLLFILSYANMSDAQKAAGLILLIGFVIMSIPNMENVIRFASDVRVHVTRIEGIKDGLREGQFPVILYPNSFNGYGEIGALYPKVFLYPAAVLRMLGISMVTSYRLMVCAINVATLLMGYISLKVIIEDKLIASFGAVLYGLFPYRMYVMGSSGSAMGRGISMAFLPMIIAGMYLILREDTAGDEANAKSFNIRGILYLSVGMSGVLMSHLLNFILSLILVVIIAVVELPKAIKHIRELAVAALVSIVACFSTIVQIIVFYSANLNLSYLKFNLYDKLFTVGDFVKSPWNLVIGVVILLYLFGIYVAYSHNKGELKIRKIEIAFLIMIVVFCVLSTTIVPYWRLLQNSRIESILSTFQNMKRFYYLTGFMVTVLACYSIKRITSVHTSAKIRYVIVGMGLICCILGCSKEVKSYFERDIMADKVVGRIEHQQIEYVPNGVDVDAFASSAAIVSDDSSLYVSSYTQYGDKAQIKYMCGADGVFTDLPMFMYDDLRLAYDEMGNVIPLTVGNNSRVRVYFDKTEVEKEINIDVRESVWFRLSAIVSLVGIAVMLYLYMRARKDIKRGN